jgi:hypothetical protein
MTVSLINRIYDVRSKMIAKLRVLVGSGSYYIDRCELWGFIREINSGIFTCENISFFPPEQLLHNYKCSGYVPCYVTVNTHTIVN